MTTRSLTAEQWELTCSYLGLLRWTLWHMGLSVQERSDAYDAALDALMRASCHWRGQTKFTTYARACIAKSVRLWRERRETKRRNEHKRERRWEARRGVTMPAGEADSIPDVTPFLAALSAKDRKLIMLRFGIGGGEPMGIADAASRLGLSPLAAKARVFRARQEMSLVAAGGGA